MIGTVSVTSSSPATVLPAPTSKPYRFIAIGNVGDKTAYLKFTSDSTALSTSNGIPLPAGASILCDQDVEKDIFRTAVTALTASGETTTISYQAY